LLTIPDAKCMNPTCGKEWTRKFMASQMSKQFMSKPYREHKERILYEREFAMMPATQPLVEEVIRKRQFEKELKRLANERNSLCHKHILLENAVYYKVTEKCGCGNEYDNTSIKLTRCNDCKQKLCMKCHIGWNHVCTFKDITKKTELQIVKSEIDSLDKQTNRLHLEMNQKRKNTEKREFIRRCSHSECRGFLSTQWKCGLCEHYTCKDCHVTKKTGEEHVCNKDDVETARLLASDSRPCPKCATLIYKIDGCDQMWCTQCHTAFSWKHGTIEKSIHNPHYYEWLRNRSPNGEIPRNPGDNGPCNYAQRDFVLDTHETAALRLIQTSGNNNTDIELKYINIVKSITHIRQVELPKFNVHLNENEELRIQFMMNELTEKQLTEKQFQTLLQRRQKRNEKKKEMHDILTAFVELTNDVLYTFRTLLNMSQHLRRVDKNVLTQQRDNLLEKLQEIDALKNYSNESLKDVSVTYNSKLFFLTYDLDKGDIHLQSPVATKKAESAHVKAACQLI
jgi:hypothetical protein